MSEEIRELRLRYARMEGAAKRLLDVLGCPADGRKGPDATLEALREAADGLVRGKETGGRSHQTADHRPQTEWKF